ncbi:MAG: hypothetical protein U0326_10370 [Polyangiales bacterium]
MNKIALTSLCSLSLLLTSSSVFAQSIGGWVGVGGGISVGGSLQVGVMPPPPPQQQVIVVQQQPVYQQPVYVPPPPPPRRVIVTTVPTYTYTTTQTVTYIGATRGRALGLGGFAAGLGFGSNGDGARGMGGVGATMRYRQHPVFATELSVAGMAGTDYNGDSRAEVPLTLSELIYFNPQNRFQVYGVIGFGASWASVTYGDASARARGVDTGSYTYVGGLAGLGVEWQLTPNFSIFGDARAFLRTRVDPNARDNPEFSRVNADGRTETSNVSTGVIGQLGGIFYF